MNRILGGWNVCLYVSLNATQILFFTGISSVRRRTFLCELLLLKSPTRVSENHQHSQSGVFAPAFLPIIPESPTRCRAKSASQWLVFQARVAWVTSFTCQNVSTGPGTEDWAVVTVGENHPAGIAEAGVIVLLEEWALGVVRSVLKQGDAWAGKKSRCCKSTLLGFGSWVDGACSAWYKFNVTSLCYTGKLPVSFNMTKPPL